MFFSGYSFSTVNSTIAKNSKIIFNINYRSRNMITTYNDSPPTIITLLHPRRCKLAIPPIFIVIPLTCSPPSPSSLLFIASTTLVQLCGVNEFDDRQLQNQSRILIRNERGKWEQFHQHLIRRFEAPNLFCS